MSTRNEMSATLPRTSMSTIDENLKRFYDFIASICGMIVFFPLFLIIMILIKWFMGKSMCLGIYFL